MSRTKTITWNALVIYRVQQPEWLQPEGALLTLTCRPDFTSAVRALHEGCVSLQEGQCDLCAGILQKKYAQSL